MKNEEKTYEEDLELEQEPDTPEKAINKITEEITSLLQDYSAGIPQEVLDTSDKTVPREKIKHPARATWFSLVNLMSSDLSRYKKKHLIYIPKSVLDNIEEYDYVISNMSPHKPIDHRRITDAVRLMQHITKEILPGVQH